MWGDIILKMGGITPSAGFNVVNPNMVATTRNPLSTSFFTSSHLLSLKTRYNATL